jgi:hypothetical protein
MTDTNIGRELETGDITSWKRTLGVSGGAKISRNRNLDNYSKASHYVTAKEVET